MSAERVVRRSAAVAVEVPVGCPRCGVGVARPCPVSLAAPLRYLAGTGPCLTLCGNRLGWQPIQPAVCRRAAWWRWAGGQYSTRRRHVSRALRSVTLGSTGLPFRSQPLQDRHNELRARLPNSSRLEHVGDLARRGGWVLADSGFDEGVDHNGLLPTMSVKPKNDWTPIRLM